MSSYEFIINNQGIKIKCLLAFTHKILFNDGTFWEICDKYPKIKEKTDLAIDFYNKLKPLFTKEYFRKISQE